MPFTLNINFKIEDFAKWKSDWDSSIDMRKAVGQGAFQIFRTVDDPNNIVLLIEWDNLENARKFMQSADLKEALKRSGVTDFGDTFYLEEVEKGSL